MKGTAFANMAALDMIRGGREHQVALFGEGLTDYLALLLATSIPLLCSPGVSVAGSAIGPWATGRTVLVALDADEAGDTAAKSVAGRIRELGGQPLRLRWPGGSKDACSVLEVNGLEELALEVEDAVSTARRRTHAATAA